MALHQSTTNAFDLVDRTEDVILLPQNWTLMNDSGMWQDEYLSTRTVTFEEQNGSLAIIKDSVPGSKPQTQNNVVRKLHSYGMTNHTLVDAIYPQDIAGVTRPGSMGKELDTKDAAVLRKMERIRKSYDRTLNLARFKTLATGQQWAPNGTVTVDFFSDFGLTQNSVNFALGTGTTDIIGKCQEIIGGFQTSATEGQEIRRVVAYCGPTWFTALINHAKVQAAYNLNSAIAPQQISRDRAGGMALYRRFMFSNIEFIEVPQVVGGEALVPANEAIFVADDGDGSFVTYHGPANRFGYVNTIATDLYLWQFEDPRATEIALEAEFAFINLLKKPNFVAKGTNT